MRNTNESHGTLITINVAAQTPLKLTSTNYLSWKLQFETIFVGYDLLGFIDGSKPCPPPTITNNTATSPNPAYSLWVRQDKLILNAIVDRYKARLVAKGFHQRPGVHFHETFSPVVKPTTIRIILSLVVTKGWNLRQLDINNAFLQGQLYEDVFMVQPPGFLDNDKPNHVCKLRKAIYGLRQAPRAWYHELRTFLLQYGFTNSISDASLFVYKSGNNIIYMIVYVDDLIVTGNNNHLINEFVTFLANKFSLKDLGMLSYFLGVEIVPNQNGILLF